MLFGFDFGPFADSIKNILSTGAVALEAFGKFLAEVISFIVDLLRSIVEKI